MGLRFLAFLICVAVTAPAGVAAAPGVPELKVSHKPKQPKSGQSVVVTVNRPEPMKGEELLLQYQVVEPGQYIALADAAFRDGWKSIPLSHAGSAKGDAGGGATLTAELPGDLQKNRRIIRYRIISAEKKAVVLAPSTEDAQPNFAYFVYDGIPEWRAAINPKGSGRQREVTRFAEDVMRSVQAVHLISKQTSIENVTWREPTQFMQPSRHEYKYTGTFVADGKVYDHVRFRARGGTWRHAMGKNMWKIDFTKGHHLEARDDWGEKYKVKWGKLNLGACIQQAEYGMRGEHGMFEALAYRLFNLARVAAPQTHWVQLRIVDGAEETPPDQYRGDFWGLYLATENVDEDFLEARGMPEGNLYKMDFGPKAEHLANGSKPEGADVVQFMNDLRRSPDERWWRSNVDLPRYYSYRSIIECIHHYDIEMGKNYFYFHDLKAGRWQVIPWDVDLTWGDQMFGNGGEPFYRAGLLQRDPCKREYEARLIEIRDLLFNSEQTGALIDEYAAIISDPKGGLSMVDADRAKWDHHPIMSSRLVRPGKADPGRFYEGSPTGDFRGMVRLMKQYVAQRAEWIDRTFLADALIPATPGIAPQARLDFAAPTLKMQLAKGNSAPKGMKWRLAEISNSKSPPGADRQPGKYEIDALWEKEGGATVDIPTGSLRKGHTYRIRARVQDRNEHWSHWSAPTQFTVPPQ